MSVNSQLSSSPKGSWDVIVIGAGVAGLMTCLELPENLNVLLLNRNTSRRSSSRWAQGGIAAVTRSEDSVHSHQEDTLNAGAGLCDKDAVQLLVREAPHCVERLQKLGMDFDRDGENLSTTLEAAHSFRRVLHVEDRTGRALVDFLQDQVEQRQNLFHHRGVRVSQLWVENDRCCGVQVLEGPLLHWISARAVVLASGGGGHLFANTTNPPQSCGEGIALAWNAGAAIEDLEFVQFHPTALQLKNAPSFLLSEALRGEGAALVDSMGQSPVSDLLGGDLAPRDQVSRALFKSMHLQGVNNLSLDLRSIPVPRLEARFPTILQRCREYGLDPVKSLIPVAPAAHYWMGGVSTDLNASTNLPGLYAVGEVACTGVHGANRLASNSLMECLVFARQMARIDLSPLVSSSGVRQKRIEKCSERLDRGETFSSLTLAIEELRNLCWEQAGVDRSPQGMQQALAMINKKMETILKQPLLQLVKNQAKDNFKILDEINRRDINILLDLNNRQLTSSLLFKACLFRRESRGGHFRVDYPLKLPYWKCHSIQHINKDISTRLVKQ